MTKFVFGTTALLLTLAAGHAHADKQQAIWEKDARDQGMMFSHAALSKTVALIDQYGDKLDVQGRWEFVTACLDGSDQVDKTIRWALCGDDLKSLDVAKLSATWQPGIDGNAERLEKLKKLGVSVEEEAKSDPGLALILKQVEAAKADWKDFVAKNHDALALYEKLKSGVRSNKSSDPNFDGCWDATQPAFAKVVKATKFHWDNEGMDAVPGRVDEIVTSPESYLSVANFSMCAYAAHASASVLAEAGTRIVPGVTIVGWRTALIARLLNHTFKPKFADRSLRWNTGELAKKPDAELQFVGSGASLVYQVGVVKTIKKDGDDTLVTFNGIVAEDCLDWKETNKIRTWNNAGDPVYERICLKRGMKTQDAPDDGTFGTKLTEGFAKGVGVGFIGGLAEEVYNTKAKKFISILSVPVKGSPAETPLKE